ncbi:MAG: N-carbamoylputrescine amidase [Arcticibacterium sp.]|jgi:N-carbamoylputrescine amidase
MKVNVGLVQMSCVSDVEANIQKALLKTREAAQKGANIVCLQELFTSLYFCDVEDPENFNLAEAIPGPTTERFQELAKELSIVIIASLFEKRAKGLYHNTTAVIDDDGSYLGKYRKMHIPDDPGYYEKYYFTPGDLGYKVWETRYGKIGVLICWDQWYPEAARITSLMGAEILFFPTAIGWDMAEESKIINMEQYEAWKTIQRSHAIANGVYVVSVNRVGQEAGQQFWGGSFVANPHGRLLYEGTHDKEEVHVQEIDSEITEYYRTTWPYLRDRRIDSYKPITKRYID